jgi:hypothetical protein
MSPGNLPRGISLASGQNNPTNNIKMPMMIIVFCISFYLIDKDGSYWSSVTYQMVNLQ